MTNQITVDLAKLRDLLTTVGPFVQRDGYAGALGAVELRGCGDFLTATATDRYTAAIKRVPAEGVDGFVARLPIENVKHLLSMFKAPRGADSPTVNLAINSSFATIVVTRGEGSFAYCFDLTVTYSLETQHLPDIAGMLRGWKPGDSSAVLYGANLLAKFTQAAGRNGRLQVHPGSGTPAMSLITIGADFVGAIMPSKLRGDDPAVGDPRKWLEATTVKAVTK